MDVCWAIAFMHVVITVADKMSLSAARQRLFLAGIAFSFVGMIVSRLISSDRFIGPTVAVRVREQQQMSTLLLTGLKRDGKGRPFTREATRLFYAAESK